VDWLEKKQFCLNIRGSECCVAMFLLPVYLTM